MKVVPLHLSWFLVAGSKANDDSMAVAEEYGCERDHSDVPVAPLKISITSEQVTRRPAPKPNHSCNTPYHL